MDLLRLRSELRNGRTIFDLPLRVTFYARVSTDKEEQLNSLDVSDFTVRIDLSDCTKTGEYEVPVTIGLPDDVPDCTVETEATVTVTLEERTSPAPDADADTDDER